MNYIKFLIIIAAFGSFQAISQNCFRFQKYSIGNSGCFAYFGTKPDSVEVSTMDDGSTVYSTQTSCSKFTFGILLIHFNKPNNDEQNWDNLLINYVDVVKEMLEIKNCVGYGKGYTHLENKAAHGVLDYCEDDKNNSYNFKGWIDSNFAAILYVTFPSTEEKNIPFSPTQELFLNGFRFN